MLPYTHHSNTNIEYQMKIEHTTYDAAHKIRARRPSTAAEKIRNLFSTRSDKKDKVPTKRVRFDLTNITSEQPVQAAAVHTNIGQAIAQEEAKLKQQQQGQKALEQSLKSRDTEAINSTRVPLYGGTSGKSSYGVLGEDKLRGKITKRDLSRPTKPKFNQATTTSDTYVNPKGESRGVQQGRLEHAPNKQLKFHPGDHKPAKPPLPTSKSKATPKESRSMIDSLNASADLLDSKRRELKGAFDKSTEKFRLSTLLAHKQRQELMKDNDSESDESFFCSGDPASTANSKTQPPTNAHHSQRSSNEGIRPLLAKEISKDSCRLCHIRDPAGMRGICVQCENTYCSPHPEVFDDCYEIKPTPPLKIRTNPTKRIPISKFAIPITPESPPPTPPLKENGLKMLKVHNVDSKPTVVTESLQHHPSQRAVLGSIEPAIQNMSSKHAINTSALKRHPSQRVAFGRVESIRKGKKTISKSARWQKGSVRNAYERTEKEASRGSDETGSSNYGSPISSSSGRSSPRYGSGGDKVPLLPGQKSNSAKGRTLQKHDSFYVLYDQILRDHGVSTPKSENLPERYDEL